MRSRALLAVLLCSCAPGDADRPVSTGGPWSVDPVPVLEITDTGAAAEPVLLYPRAGTVLSSGVIAVVDQFEPGVRFFSPDGRLIRTAGREGAGPGEFQTPTWLGQCQRDSLFVWDASLGRISVLDSAGAVAREYEPAHDPSMLRCNRAGRFAFFSQPQGALPDLSDVTAVVHASLWLGNATGDSIASLGVQPMGESRTMGKVTQFTLSAQSLFVGAADSPVVSVYDTLGRPSARIVLDVPIRPATERHYRRAMDVALAMFAGADYRERIRRVLLRQPMPEHLPLYTGLLADTDNVLWVRVSSPGDSVTRVLAVSQDGRELADLVLPRELVLFEVGPDYVLGAAQDSSFVHHLLMYRLSRGRDP